MGVQYDGSFLLSVQGRPGRKGYPGSPGEDGMKVRNWCLKSGIRHIYAKIERKHISMQMMFMSKLMS